MDKTGGPSEAVQKPVENSQRPRRAWATYLGVFTIALSTLMLEVLLTRIASVIAVYHLAFFIISLGMLGMTAGAVTVFLLPKQFPADRVRERAAQAALGFALSVPVSVGLTMSYPLAPVIDLMTFIALLGTGLLLAIPFVLGGIALTLALTRSQLPANLVYGVDLVGAATGCVAIILLLDLVDAPSAALAAAAVGALSALCFALAARKSVRLSALVVLALVICTGLNAGSKPSPFRPLWVKGFMEDPARFDQLLWNTYSRITGSPPIEGPPGFWAKGTHTPPEVLAPRLQRYLQIDGGAGTIMTLIGEGPESHHYLEWDTSCVVHRLRPLGPAAVIGVGGGRDIIAALQSGHKPVLGVELNEHIIALHEGPYREFGGIAGRPDVKLVVDEARSYFARSDEKFTVLTMSLIDTWASTGAGAYSLSENGLYTREAFEVFLNRLTNDGFFAVSRWYVPHSPGETGRMLALAMETLYARGAENPADHLLMFQSELVATLLVSPSPLSPADMANARKEAELRGYNILVGPGIKPPHPLLAALVTQPSREALWQWTRQQSLDFTPPTDDRPFFFNMLKPSTWLRSRSTFHELDLPILGNLQATQTLLYATLVSTLLTLVTLVWPAYRRRRQLKRYSAGQVLSASGYFAMIGLGFMFVEMGMLSRLNVFLGHPTLALSVLLSSLIFFTGLGSMLSGKVNVNDPRLARAYPLLPVIMVIATEVAVEPLMAHFQPAATAARVLMCVGLLAPLALSLGLGFPMGLRLVERMEARVNRRTPLPEADSTPALAGEQENPLGPWLWGINGACSVCASGLGLGLSMVYGIPTTMAVGGVCYALLLPCTFALFRAGTPR